MKKFVVAAAGATVLLLLILTDRAMSQIQPPPPPPIPSAVPSPSAPTPTATPRATPKATPKATPRATAIAVPTAAPTSTAPALAISVRFTHGFLVPGTRQTVRVATLPSALVSASVRFPNGDGKSFTGTAGKTGALIWRYKQPASTITHSRRKGVVTVDVSSGGQTVSLQKHYTIGFAPLDVAVQPRTQTRGKAIMAWLHSSPGVALHLVFHFPGGLIRGFRGHTGRDGWMGMRYVVPRTVQRGKAQVAGYGLIGRRQVAGETTFRVR